MKRSEYINKLLFLCMILVIGRFAYDMYFPSMPVIADYFKVEYHVIELTVTAYLFGMTLCQLIFGPSSDAWGRKAILVMGMMLFTIGSAICVCSENHSMLIFGRFVCGSMFAAGFVGGLVRYSIFLAG